MMETMNINPWFWPTLLLALLVFVGGFAFDREKASRAQIVGLYVLGVLAALPGLLYIFYYAHWYDNWVSFFQFRTQTGSELLAAGLGFYPGLLARDLLPRLKGRGVLLLAGMVLLGVFIPHMKPVIAPLDKSRFEDRWSGQVCLQTTEASCGLASLATLLKYHRGMEVSELELVKEAYTYRGGTEIWYLARCARRRDINTAFLFLPGQPDILPWPVIAGVKLGGEKGVGHFLTVLGYENGRYLIGEPLEGPLRLTREELEERYYFTGFFMIVN